MVGPCGASSVRRAASSAGLRAAGHSTLNSDSSLGSWYLRRHTIAPHPDTGKRQTTTLISQILSPLVSGRAW